MAGPVTLTRAAEWLSGWSSHARVAEWLSGCFDFVSRVAHPLSFRTTPEEFKEHVIDAPERIQFATGVLGGVKPSSKALNL